MANHQPPATMPSTGLSTHRYMLYNYYIVPLLQGYSAYYQSACRNAFGWGKWKNSCDWEVNFIFKASACGDAKNMGQIAAGLCQTPPRQLARLHICSQIKHIVSSISSSISRGSITATLTSAQSRRKDESDLF